MAEGTGARLSRAERRTQLVGHGLKLLEQVPFQSLSVDDVAERAGISRSLLFHYFPTKRAYLAAVIRTAAELVLDLTEVPASVRPDDRTRAMITAYVRFIHRRRANYVAVIRSARSVDPELEGVIDELQETLARRALDSAGMTDPDPMTMVAARGWLAAVEQMALLTDQAGIPPEVMIDYCLDTFRRHTERDTLHRMMDQD